MADTVNGVLPHLHARDVTFLLVSQAPLAKLQPYKRRMGWGPPWVSTARSDFNFDLGFSFTEDQAREAVAELRPTGLATRRGNGLPPIVEHNASTTGTDAVGYLTESPGFSTFVRDDGAVYDTYSTTWRGLRTKATVVGRMKEYEPSDELQFLMELSIEPIAAKLGLLTPSA
jgi:predicted dithiol-disulfide oxidoreductase (DUF899 family)